ncbi:ectonucleotide pyrophosphatase/phosphodiesterase [Acidicapsa dinghuensis]|uniref:Ectonucleotide pyrophosphatase/phosphodiesterase n=1 Tax=Acidicapsa dinghuensis TaxID=2218256 RepID=A0ABW1EMK4_9BACT|nr:ectonucleotide pyrophosphatase/phosphodiesterase [Acidicapsa dinghuensis]
MRSAYRLKTVFATAALLAGFCASSEIVPAQDPSGSSGAHPIVVIHTDQGPNSAQAMQQHYVVLVSLDGFRWDYAKKYNAAHLLALGKEGVWAPEGMIPSYPSLTFPNHYAIITGLYPEHNGLVANSFLDTTEFAHYGLSDPAPVADGHWYAGVPLWSLAEKQGMRTACLFWPGSEAKIAGEVPTDYLHFDDKVDESARIDQVIAWLKEPAEQRPHFITLYYSDVDHAGHAYGPDSPQTKSAVARVDGLVAKLHDALKETGLPIDLVVVSDHGMVKIQGPWVNLDDYADLKGFQSAGPLLYGASEADRARVYDQLKHASEKFEVYRRKDVPAGLRYDENPREGDPVIVPIGPYAIRAHGPGKNPDGTPRPDRAPEVGAHGFDPRRMPEMKASFFAAGPDIVEGKTVQPFENVNLYPWIAHILGLEPPKTDGNLNILSGTLRDNGDSKAATVNAPAPSSQE